MSTPLASAKVNEIRDLFDDQLKNPHKVPAAAAKPNKMDLQKEKQAILNRLQAAKAKLDQKLPTRHTAASDYLDQTVDVPTASNGNAWMQSTDESFLRWEQDCDTTQRPAAAPVSSAAPRDPEMAAIDRLMREYNLESGSNDDDPDQTQLEDIEPPSGIWETTISGAKLAAASPLKQMLSRPSTIAEEEDSTGGGGGASFASLASSYKTAASARTSRAAPSERYETATETICLSSDQSDNTPTDVIEILDEESESSGRASTGVRNTLDGIASLPADDESCYGSKTESRDSGDFSLPEESDLSAPDFNDTFERIEFMEQQGKRLLEQQKLKQAVAAQPPSTPKTLLPAAVTTTKRVFYPSPSAMSSSTSSSPGTFKRPGGFTRSPQVKFVPPKRNFDHIVSPIATYIKDVPTQTLYTKYKGQCLFSKSSPIKPNAPQTRRDAEAKENKQSQLRPPQWNIPRKVFTATNNRHEIDNRQQSKIPGGLKVHQMVQPAVDQPMKIIRHEGRMELDTKPTAHQPRDSIFDETLANMSVVSGDVSIQVIRDMKKY